LKEEIRAKVPPPDRISVIIEARRILQSLDAE
jgi:hypothetical protein